MQDESERLVGRFGVATMFSCSLASVERFEKQGVIPPRRQLSNGRVGWLHSELVAALRALPAGPLVTRTAAARTPEARAKAVANARATREARRDGAVGLTTRDLTPDRA